MEQVLKFLINIAPQFAGEVLVLFPYFSLAIKFQIAEGRWSEENQTVILVSEQKGFAKLRKYLSSSRSLFRKKTKAS